ncbi:ATP-binding protein [Trichocoleus sp. FACHB-40]|uniref:sensor histidine kinase n=2 Tax=Cyanophyceae TaxID=3028117 RepID=UPI001687590C|nr:ATP-binding protein [Trichocoleus sp. FACHB-40]
MSNSAVRAAWFKRVRGAMINDLNQLFEDSQQRLQELWQYTEELSELEKQPIVEVLEQLSSQLQEMQVVTRYQIRQRKLATNTRVELVAQGQHYQSDQELHRQADSDDPIVAIAASNDIAYLVTNPQGVILEANRTAAQLLDNSQECLLGNSLVEFVAADARGDFHAQLSALQQGAVVKNWEIGLAKAQGELFTGVLSVEPVRQVQQPHQVVGLRWFLQDITETKYNSVVCLNQRKLECVQDDLENLLAESLEPEGELADETECEAPHNMLLRQTLLRRTWALQRALKFEAMLKLITDKLRDTLDENQILQTAVQELTLVLGVEGCDTALYNADRTATITHEYTIGLPSALGEVVSIDNLFAEDTQLLQGQYFQFCYLVPGIRGQVAILACPIFDNQGMLGDLWLYKRHEEAFNELEIRLAQQVASGCAIAIRQARLYQATRSQVVELEKLTRLKDDFLSTVPHELRSPVANMKMAIQMLGIALNKDHGLFAELSKPPAKRNKVARYFHILHNECEREINLVNDLLEWQKLDTEVQPLVLTTIEMLEWLPKVIEPFVQQAQERQLNLEINIEPELPPLVCDHASLGRILSELLTNACKYTPTQEKIIVTARTAQARIEVSVNNTGVEIPASERERIFEKFYRIPSTDPWKQGGTGLGLALVQKRVALLGGTIQLESSANQTCFTVSLPLKPSEL